MKTPFAAAVVSTVCFALLLGGPGAGASAETQTVAIKSYKQPERLLNVQDGAPLADSAAVQSPAAQWRLEATGEASSYWTIVPIGGDTDKITLGPTGPGPDTAPEAGTGDLMLPAPVLGPQ